MPNLLAPLMRRQADSDDDDDDVQHKPSTPASKKPRFSSAARRRTTTSKENSARRSTVEKEAEESGIDSIAFEVTVKRPQRSTAPTIDYKEERPPNIRARHKRAPSRPAGPHEDAPSRSFKQRGRSVYRAAEGGADKARPSSSTAQPTDIAGPSGIKKTSDANIKMPEHVAKKPAIGAEANAVEDHNYPAHEMAEYGAIDDDKFDEHLEDSQKNDLAWLADEECFLFDIVVMRELQDFQAIIDECEEALWANAEDDDDADVSGTNCKEASWEVEKILFIDRKESNTALVKWRGWPYKADYWEAMENLTGCKDLFEDYKRRLKLNTTIAAKLKFDDRLLWPELWESPAFLRCHEWEDEISRKSVEAGCAPLYVENWVDKEPRPKNFEFVMKNIISDETRATFVKPSPPECMPCQCGENCGAGSSCCPKNLGYKLFYTAANRLYSRYDRRTDFLIECGPECNCDVRTCPTRVVQRGRQIPLTIFRTANRGWGLRTTVKIAPRTFVAEYVGELLPIEKSKERSGAYSFDVNGHGSGATKYFIDSQYCGNEARFVNHSCEPNLEAVNVYCEREDRRYWRIAFFSRDKEVQAGEELTLSYIGDDEKEFGKRAASRKKPNCQCGAKTCRKYF